MIRKKVKLIKVTYICDFCEYEVELVVPKHNYKSYPEYWGIAKREGGGHYGLPIHKYNVCPTCYEKEKKL
jgi:hypothetical protein